MQTHAKFLTRRAAIDPQVDFCRDRLECSLRIPVQSLMEGTISRQIAMLASLAAYFSRLNR